MAVRAPHVTFFNLLLQLRQCHRRVGHGADVSDLRAPHVVELEYYRIGEATVTPRMCAEKLRDKTAVDVALSARSLSQCYAKGAMIVAIILSIRSVLTGPAIRLKSVRAAHSLRELVQYPLHTTTPTLLHAYNIANQCASVVASDAASGVRFRSLPVLVRSVLKHDPEGTLPAYGHGYAAFALRARWRARRESNPHRSA